MQNACSSSYAQASGIAGFNKIFKAVSDTAPMRRNVNKSAIWRRFYGSVALPVDKRVLDRNGRQFLTRDGFFLPTHKTGQQKTA